MRKIVSVCHGRDTNELPGLEMETRAVYAKSMDWHSETNYSLGGVHSRHFDIPGYVSPHQRTMTEMLRYHGAQSQLIDGVWVIHLYAVWVPL